MNARSSWSATEALMEPGKDCYPYSAAAIQEAVGQAQIPELARMQEACESGDWNEAGFALRELVRNYWERQAVAVFRERQIARTMAVTKAHFVAAVAEAGTAGDIFQPTNS